MVSQQQIDGFHREGFLNYGPLLSESETAELREALQRVVEGRSEAKPEAVSNLLGESEEVVRISSHTISTWHRAISSEAGRFRR